MCRVTLMNRQAVLLLKTVLGDFFAELEASQGGDGNGVAGLWQQRGAARICKGVDFTPEESATRVLAYAEQRADWMLFHTRRASSSPIFNRHCHPFRSGDLVLAHNGHDIPFARLASSLDLSDSECIARAWAKMGFPLATLATRSGVFMGFARGVPFVVKGQYYSNLVLALQRETGAVLFASELPHWLKTEIFDEVVSVPYLQWFGRDLDQDVLDRCEPCVPGYVAKGEMLWRFSYPNKKQIKLEESTTMDLTRAFE